jgi:hypothetical protein
VLEEPRLTVVTTATPQTAGAKKSAQRRPPDSRPAATSAPDDAAGDLPDEVFVAGTADQPGRRIRLRQINRR